MDVRVRMVILGLILGVIVAVVVAAHGCGQKNLRPHANVPAATDASL